MVNAREVYAPTLVSSLIERVTFKAKGGQNLQPDKASGPGHIPARILKECGAELARPHSLLFQLCFNQGVFSSQWKTASGIPIHKRDIEIETIYVSSHLIALHPQ